MLLRAARAVRSYLLAWIQNLERLRETRTILDIMSEGLLIQDETGQVVNFNPAALEILGLTEDELLGRKARDPQWRIVREDGTNALPEEHPALIALKLDAPVRDVTVGLRLPNAPRRWIKINAVPVQAPQGRRVVVTFTNITEQYLLAVDMQGIFKHSRDLICIADLNGNFMRVSPSFTRALGYSEGKLIGTSMSCLLHPDDLKEGAETIALLAEGKVIAEFETRVRTADGHYRRISWACEPRLKAGLIYAIGRDVTDQRVEERRHKEIFSALNRSAIVAFTDMRGKIREVNDKFCEVSGYSREELIGKDHRILSSGTHPKSFFAQLWNTIKDGRTWTGDIENRTKSGEHYNVRTVIAPLINLDGEIEQFLSIRFDVTQEKALERQLEEAQRIAQIGSWRYDLQTEKRTWSPQTYKVFEIEETQSSEVLTQHLQSHMHEEDWQQYQEHLARAKSHGTDFAFNHRIYVGPERRIKYLRGVCKVQLDSEGRPRYLTGAVQDVTELSLKELELKRLIDLNGAIMRSARVAIVTTAPDGVVTAYNEEAERILGYSAEEAIGKITPNDFHDKEEVKNASREISRELGVIVPDGFEALTYKAKLGLFDERQWTFIRKDGGRRQVWLSVTALRDSSGKISGFLGMVKDMSHELKIKKELEEERTKAIHNSRLASLGEMSAGVAHEINNPLAIIAGTTMTLDKYRNDPEKFETKVDAIIKAAGRIEKIVKGLRKFARSSDGSPYAWAPLSEIISESIVLTEPKCKRYAVTIFTEVRPGLNVLCDRAEIEQVIINLINNGVDAVKNLSDRWIRVRAYSETFGVVLQIVDSGGGITSEVEQKLFQPFFTTKKVGEGTGLGLSITKGILDQHKATIALNRTMDHTCFEIRFSKNAA